MTERTDIVPRAERPKTIAMGSAGLALTTLEDAYRFAQYVVKSRLAPEGDTAEAVLIKLQAGAELGFAPMRALSALVVVNGRLSMMGEAVLALCRASGRFKEIKVGVAGSDDDRRGFVTFIRPDTGEGDTVTFSVAEAKAAKLWQKKSPSGKDTPWIGYADDMLIWRAVSRFGKRYASDILMGIEPAEPLAETVRNVQPQRQQVPPPDDTPDPVLEFDEVVDGNA